MMDLITHALAFGLGGTVVWLAVYSRIEKLSRLTDRDARGRFVRRERP